VVRVFVLLLVSALVGAASVLTPCVLPLLPAILAASAGGQRSRSWGIVTGVVATFGIAVLALGEAVSALGLPANTLRWVAVVILVGFGVVLLVPALEHRFGALMQRVVARGPRGAAGRTGFRGGLVLGSGLGLVWSPCAGPLFASVTAATATGTGLGQRVAITTAYALGMSLPLAAIVLGGAGVGRRLMRASHGGSLVLPVMGVVLLATGLVIGTGTDTRLNAWVSTHTGWSSTPLAGLQQHVVSDNRGGGGRSGARINFGDADAATTTGGQADTMPAALGGADQPPLTDGDSDRPVRFDPDDLKRNGYPQTEVIRNFGPAPEFAGISRWYNTPDGQPLTMSQLRGKVVLVDFWTYSCINCLRALPHVQQLWDRYRDQGLVVVGVHTPEFAFEADPGNVGAAVKRLGITYPVALDPKDVTWGQYHNQYWPAHYLIDQDGRIRATHYGEGAYDRTEALVRHLLGLSGTTGGRSDLTTALPDTAPDSQGITVTPETYLGSERSERAISSPQNPGVGDPVNFTLPADAANLPVDAWGFTGTWTVDAPDAVAGPDAGLALHYRGRHVYMVLAPPPGQPAATVTVTDGTNTHAVTIDGNRLYTVWDDAGSGSGIITLHLSPGTIAYTFTFG
jgi:cytochrome c biogenesis protein CcdA/thiol-disulfide isomerase/thioredoxin